MHSLPHPLHIPHCHCSSMFQDHYLSPLSSAGLSYLASSTLLHHSLLHTHQPHGQCTTKATGLAHLLDPSYSPCHSHFTDNHIYVNHSSEPHDPNFPLFTPAPKCPFRTTPTWMPMMSAAPSTPTVHAVHHNAYTLAAMAHVPYPSCAFHAFDPSLTGAAYASNDEPPHAGKQAPSLPCLAQPCPCPPTHHA